MSQNDCYELAQKIMDLVFEDKKVTQLYRQAMRECVATGEISDETIREVELRIREVISEWEV